MSDLFTVRMQRKIIKSFYDKKGNRTGETTTFVEESYSDLPQMTAQSYLRRFPEAKVVIERQEQRWGDKARVRVGDGEKQKVRRTHIEGFAKAGTKPVGEIKRTRLETPKETGIDTGSYADVVNKMTAA